MTAACSDLSGELVVSMEQYQYGDLTHRNFL